MKIYYLMSILLLFALIACVSAESFMPDEGIFAYREVEIHEINGINFTVPTDYEVTFENSTQMDFRHEKDKLKISVINNGTVKKVKKNPSKNITSGKTMFGSVEGYLVDKNGTYTFSYKEDEKLVVIKSKDMALMIGAMGKD
ncbi:MAG: hypothetical protein IJ258_09295 [Methanobrevibacter sp.]|uniref:hypothetical protein n=1 Tax=Methanobrevibacter sp. TaxID=66852 RepID=UPI0025DFD277|nr:hypothetical protein [Methanobrevibacter sp.]MBQ8018281.1 hypothetical protein [Methanobrevibacter sp.]